MIGGPMQSSHVPGRAPGDAPDDLTLTRFLERRHVPRAVFDFIAHNLGTDAAIAAVLVGEYRPPAPPG